MFERGERGGGTKNWLMIAQNNWYVKTDRVKDKKKTDISVPLDNPKYCVCNVQYREAMQV